MKAAVVFALLAGASADHAACVIPDTYATSTAGACTGVNRGYSLFGVCNSGVDPRFVDVNDATYTRVAVTDDNLGAFTADAAIDAPGCIVPATPYSWSANNLVITGAALADNCDIAGGGGGNYDADLGILNPITVDNGNFKGLEIRCAAGYFPSQGTEGVNTCNGGRALSINDVANTFQVASTSGAAYFSPGFNQVLANNDETLAASIPQFTGDNALECQAACTLPTDLCADDALFPNVISSGAATNYVAGCRVRPTRTNIVPNSGVFRFSCGTAAGANRFTITCVPGAAEAGVGAALAVPATITPAYTGQCGSRDGAASIPLIDVDNHLAEEGFPIAGTPFLTEAGEFEDYPLVTTVFRFAFRALSAEYTAWTRQNVIAPVNFQFGNVYDIAVIGCNQATGALRIQCVQTVLNWYRCETAFPFLGATCFANGGFIACPTADLGFHCDSTSSKKGLLLLLLLLLIIPLCCLLCCCLLLCCIRRRKTEADVHFATFDPLGAPAVATAVVPTHMDIPTACATPHHGSAMY